MKIDQHTDIQPVLVVEGGNVFKGQTSGIKKENISPTLNEYFKELAAIFPNKSKIFNEQYFNPVGSVGKVDESGDIDLAVDVSVILDKDMSDNAIAEWGVDPAEVLAEFQLLTKRARTSTPSQLRMKAFLKVLAKQINIKAPVLKADEKKVSTGNMFGLYPQSNASGKKLDINVQIDWMVGDLPWLKFSYYSAPRLLTSNVKGLHRTQLMLSAFQVANLSFNHVTGVKDKDTDLVVAHDPGQALAMLSARLGFDILQEDAEDYFKLHALLKEKMKPADYSQLLNVYFKILDSTRADIPNNLQEEWILRKDKLSLSGKFLPATSNLLAQL
jgi:hypothetical protein